MILEVEVADLWIWVSGVKGAYCGALLYGVYQIQGLGFSGLGFRVFECAHYTMTMIRNPQHSIGHY